MTIYRSRSIGNAFSAGCSAVFIFHRYRHSFVACMEIMVGIVFSYAVAQPPRRLSRFPFFFFTWTRTWTCSPYDIPKDYLYCIIQYVLSNIMGSASNCFQGQIAANCIVHCVPALKVIEHGVIWPILKFFSLVRLDHSCFSSNIFLNLFNQKKFLLANSMLSTPGTKTMFAYCSELN